MTNDQLISTARSVSTYLWGECSTLVTQLADALEESRCKVWHLEAELAEIRDQKLRVAFSLGINERSAAGWRDPDGHFYHWNPWSKTWDRLTLKGTWHAIDPAANVPYTEVLDQDTP